MEPIYFDFSFSSSYQEGLSQFGQKKTGGCVNDGLQWWEQTGDRALILSQPPCSDLSSLLIAVCRLAEAR